MAQQAYCDYLNRYSAALFKEDRGMSACGPKAIIFGGQHLL